VIPSFFDHKNRLIIFDAKDNTKSKGRQKVLILYFLN
jgi:hypothetical protein